MKKILLPLLILLFSANALATTGGDTNTLVPNEIAAASTTIRIFLAFLQGYIACSFLPSKNLYSLNHGARQHTLSGASAIRPPDASRRDAGWAAWNQLQGGAERRIRGYLCDFGLW